MSPTGQLSKILSQNEKSKWAGAMAPHKDPRFYPWFCKIRNKGAMRKCSCVQYCHQPGRAGSSCLERAGAAGAACSPNTVRVGSPGIPRANPPNQTGSQANCPVAGRQVLVCACPSGALCSQGTLPTPSPAGGSGFPPPGPRTLGAFFSLCSQAPSCLLHG